MEILKTSLQIKFNIISAEFRIATFLYYLDVPNVGGGTVFPTLDLSVHPNSGDALLWFNMKADESQEYRSLHGGCPVVEGEKTAATFWIRARGQEFRIKCPRNSDTFDTSSFQGGCLKRSFM